MGGQAGARPPARQTFGWRRSEPGSPRLLPPTGAGARTGGGAAVGPGFCSIEQMAGDTVGLMKGIHAPTMAIIGSRNVLIPPPNSFLGHDCGAIV